LRPPQRAALFISGLQDQSQRSSKKEPQAQFSAWGSYAVASNRLSCRGGRETGGWGCRLGPPIACTVGPRLRRLLAELRFALLIHWYRPHTRNGHLWGSPTCSALQQIRQLAIFAAIPPRLTRNRATFETNIRPRSVARRMDSRNRYRNTRPAVVQ
jgi:hypothetical protein